MLVRQPTRVYRNWVSDSRRWNSYRPRAGDIVIATYPKSGTTWMQQIVSLLVFQSPEPRPVAEIAPWLDMRTLQPSAEAVMETLDLQTHRRFIKCHVAFDGMPIYGDVKYIHVARDGRDACLSYHNHCSALDEQFIAAMDAVGRDDETIGREYPRPPSDPRAFFHRWMSEGAAGDGDGSPFGSWFHFERTYWNARFMPNLLMVHYRDLKADLVGEMKRVAQFLGIDVPESKWPGLVEAASFTEMRRSGDKLFPKVARVFRGGAESFFHKGENDRWRNVLNEEDCAKFEDRARVYLDPECIAWLQSGGHPAHHRV